MMHFFNGLAAAEKLLKNYHGLQRAKKTLDQRISRLVARAAPRPLRAAAIEEMIRARGRQDDALNLLFEIKGLTDARAETQLEIERIDNALEVISQPSACRFYGPVLRSWYIEKLPKHEIAQEIGYSSRQTIYDIRNAALRQFAVEIFGIRGMV